VTAEFPCFAVSFPSRRARASAQRVTASCQRFPRAFTAALLLAVVACGGDSPTAPIAEPAVPTALALPLPTVRISEFHYDNTGTDVNERIEVSFPTGTVISGYSSARYNGNPATAAVPYTTPAGPGVLTGASTASRSSIRPVPSSSCCRTPACLLRRAARPPAGRPRMCS